MFHLDGNASKIVPDQLYLDRDTNTHCISVSVWSDTSRSQTITLGLVAGDSRFKVMGNEAIIAIVNNKGKLGIQYTIVSNLLLSIYHS